MVVSIKRALGDIVSGFQPLAKLRHKGDGVAHILTIRLQAGGRMDRRRLFVPSDTGPRGRLWMEDNDLHLTGPGRSQVTVHICFNSDWIIGVAAEGDRERSEGVKDSTNLNLLHA